MKTQIRRIGNSLGNTIPAPIIRKMGLSVGSEIEVTDEGDIIILRPIRKHRLPRYTETELLRNLDVHNSHADEVASLNDNDMPGVEW